MVDVVGVHSYLLLFHLLHFIEKDVSFENSCVENLQNLFSKSIQHLYTMNKKRHILKLYDYYRLFVILIRESDLISFVVHF